MRRLLVTALSLSLATATVPAWTAAAAECPPELAEAKAALQKVASKKAQMATPRGGKDRPNQGPEGAPVPRGGKDRPNQGPEGAPVPRGQGIQASPGQEIQAPHVAKARALVRQADEACRKGDLALSAQKAREALELLK